MLVFLGSSQGDADGDNVACHVDDDVFHQQLAAAGGLHQGHRRLVQPLRLLRLLGSARIRPCQLRRQVYACTSTSVCVHKFAQEANQSTYVTTVSAIGDREVYETINLRKSLRIKLRLSERVQSDLVDRV